MLLSLLSLSVSFALYLPMAQVWHGEAVRPEGGAAPRGAGAGGREGPGGGEGGNQVPRRGAEETSPGRTVHARAGQAQPAVRNSTTYR